jgi:hypothetical protein
MDVLRQAGIFVDTPYNPRDIGANHYAEPNWKRIAGWCGAAALVSMTLLLYVVDEISRRS